MEKLIAGELQESIRVKEAVIENLLPAIAEAARLIINALQEGRKLLLFGNGGSAADAQHIAGELVGQFERKRKALPAIALTTNTSNLTAIGNDYGFEYVFSRQLEALAAKGDIAFAISASGESPNILEALRTAKELKLKAIALSGKGGGSLKDLADICITIPSDNTAHIQEAHIAIGHIICKLIEEELFGSD